MRRRLGLLMAAALTAASMTWTVHADTTDTPTASPTTGDNSAVAINTTNGSSVIDVAFSIVRATGDTVTNTNLALAYASCTSCQTVAIAFQVVLITGDPHVITPQNVAIAVNYQCSLCSTMASAVQFVISTPGPVTFTREGRHQLAEIRRALERLRREHLTLEQIAAEVERLRLQLANVLATQLVPLNQDNNDQNNGNGPSPKPLSTDSATATASPSGTSAVTTRSPSPSATASPAAATATATPSPTP
jgi:putative peptide zinc metalloprotease protein